MARFRTSARTVDMLGRQQIAGIPTAISELFKNAYDAYARHIEVDFYRPEYLLVLRDDGLGMTLAEVEDRWLVLGTESKVANGGGLAEVASELGLERRQPMGEKGIGRLAIAAIGPQVLLVTRARRAGGPQPTVVSFVNWSLFTLPGISLDEIEVPILVFDERRLPNSDDLESMVDAVRANLETLSGRIGKDRAADIGHELDLFSLDVASVQERFTHASLGSPSDAGTQFFIQPTDPMLVEELDTTPQPRRIGNLQRMLMGFTNTMMPRAAEPPVTAEFRDHKSIDLSDPLLGRDKFDSVIGPDDFFTPEDFESADHHFHGEFDEYGQFAGMVSVYGGDPEDYSVVWTEARGRKTECGQFRIDFAYVQGEARESRMPREEWARLAHKLDSMGGLYIYRNGIRILPYGGVDNDFLGIEQRRSLRAGGYFFSYRRMLGAIELPTSSSRRLVEKAGREGFRENRAYRQFRAILENFFVQLAADYFRTEASRGDQFRVTKEELGRQAKALQQRRRETQERRGEISRILKCLWKRLDDNEPEVAAQSIVRSMETVMMSAGAIGDRSSRLHAVLRAEDTARRKMSELKERFRVPEHRGVGLKRTLQRDLNAYASSYARLDEDVFAPVLEQIDNVVARVSRSTGIEVSRQQRLDVTTEAALRAAKSAVSTAEQNARAILNETVEVVKDSIRHVVLEFDRALEDVAERLRRSSLLDLTDAEFVQLRMAVDSELESLVIKEKELLELISKQLQTIAVAPDESGQVITPLDVTEAVEEELLALQSRAEADLELTHLGMAIEIIDHEFQSSVRSIRQNLRRFRAWAEVNEDLADVYHGIRTNFEHLDGYLTLFTPLHRRLYRTKVEIKGSEIGKYLSDLFNTRFSRHRIEMDVSESFLRHRVWGFPSTFYPVFINLIDNAVYWLQDRCPLRTIQLDAVGDAMIVADNGPGIAAQDREAIFELGFTRKRGGRGLGLYISRDVLKRVGYDLEIESPADGLGAAFAIKPREMLRRCL